MRKHVAPAVAGTLILDPDRGRALPDEGLPVAWSAYWATHEARGDVVVSEIAASETVEDAPAPAAEPAPPTAEADAPEPVDG